MKLLVTSDEHFQNSNSKFRLDREGVSDLLKAQVAYYEMLADELESGDYDGFISGGDTADAAILDPITAHHMNKAIKRIVEATNFHLFLEGNHCVSDSRSLFTVLGTLKELRDDLTVVLREGKVIWELPSGEYVTFHCFPYQSDYRLLEERIAISNDLVDPNDGDLDIMLFHFGVKNAMLDNGFESPSGVNLSTEMVSNFDICLGGDYHTRQNVHSHVHYIGAPFDLKFGEHYRRGAMVLDITPDGYDIDYIENPYQYDILKLSPEEFLSYDGHNSKTIVKIDGEPTPEQRVQIEKLKGEFYNVSVPRVRAKRDDEDIRVDVIEGDSQRDVDLVRAQMKKNDVDDRVAVRAVELFEEIQR
jgi:hypothetical protein